MATKAKEATYKSAYSATIDDLVNKAVNRQPFQYDPATDAAYQSYARQYTRLGDQAARDTLADVSAQTGGLPSSYAVTAAEQARSNYNQALTDKIPALMEAAYAKYRDEYNDTLAGINTLQGIDDSLYNRFATDRDFKENVRQFGLNYALDKAQFNEGKRQFNLNYKLDKDSAKFEKMLNTWTTLGYANKEVAKYFGIDKGTKTDDSAYRWAQMAMAQAKSGGGSGGRGGGGRRGRGGGSGSGGYATGTDKYGNYYEAPDTEWYKDDIAHQAMNIATRKVHNGASKEQVINYLNSAKKSGLSDAEYHEIMQALGYEKSNKDNNISYPYTGVINAYNK